MSLGIGHFRVPKTLTFKMRLGAQPFFEKMSFICMSMKNDFSPYQRLSTYPHFETDARGTRKWPIGTLKVSGVPNSIG